jgi:hypothetical protein
VGYRFRKKEVRARAASASPHVISNPTANGAPIMAD